METKRVVIVGGAGGLGSAVARMMAARGAAAIAIIDPAEDAMARVVAAVAAEGAAAHAIPGDATTQAGARDAFERAAAALGQVDSLVNCAGFYPRKAILEIDDGDWQTSFEVNVKATHHMMAAAAAHMRPRKAGRIVNISSIDAFKAHPHNAHYAAMKAAVVSLTKSFAMAFAGDQILINSVAPAAIATERAKASGFMAELIAANPLGRAAEPEDIAEMILFLASSRNTYVTGENVIVSGGYIMH